MHLVASIVMCYALGSAVLTPALPQARVALDEAAPVAFDSGGVSLPSRFAYRRTPTLATVAATPSDGHARRRSGSAAYRLPVSRQRLSPALLSAPHHDYPAWDLGLPTGTVVHAVHAGVVTTVTNDGRCGNGVIVDGDDGYTYTYCHGSTVLVSQGERIAAGRRVMLSGSSGRSTGPHLHLQMAAGASLLCPQQLLLALYAGEPADPSAGRGGDCFYMTDDPETPINTGSRGHKASKGAGSRGSDEQRPPTGGNAPKPGDHDEPSPPQGSPSSPPEPTPTPGPSPSPTPRPSPSPTPTPSPAATP